MQVVTSAPGKIIVAGEYAVLQGAPAVCAAVNRRALVSISHSDSGEHSVSAPGFRERGLRFESIAEVAEELPLLAAVWGQFPMASQAALNIEIDTRRFYSGSEKLGIGSSAAAVVALTAAFAAIYPGGSNVGKQARAAHLALQNGRGSGADVASSHQGGVIEYRMQAAESVSLSWPKNLHYALLWSGRSCSTTAQLQKLDGARSSDAVAELVMAAEDVAIAWRSNVVQRILTALQGYADALRHYDDENQLDIFSAGHAALTEQAASSQVVYKPCGAGGGDFGIAVADDSQKLLAFIAVAEAKGFERSDLAIDSAGMVLDRREL